MSHIFARIRYRLKVLSRLGKRSALSIDSGKNFERDQQLGYTFSGPNKADLRIKVNATPVEDVLSRGQLKLMVCALRVAQGQHLTELTGKQCIYLIDDFASELDSLRRQRLADSLKGTGRRFCKFYYRKPSGGHVR